MKKIDTTPSLYSLGKAEALAAELNGSDDDWTYRAIHDPKGTGYSKIAAYDEDGEFVANL